MSKLKDDKLVLAAYISLAVAVLSVFTTIIGYTNSAGVHRSFSIIDLLNPGASGFEQFVSYEYVGVIYWNITMTHVTILAIISIVALIFAVVGLMLISKQKENRGSFALTVVGLIGTMMPSVILLIITVVLRASYKGRIYCGIYPIVSPIAMIVCIIATTQMHRRNLEAQKKLESVNGLIFKGGDL